MLSFENDEVRRDEDINFFDQPVNNVIKTYKNTWKIATHQRDDYENVCLQEYSTFSKNHKMIATYPSKQQLLDADPRVIQQINFTGNLWRDGVTQMIFIPEEVRESIFDFSQETVKEIVNTLY